MKKVIRLNENDIEKLVRKIISEEKKSVNEGVLDFIEHDKGPFGWMRKKFNNDEELGLLILKGLEKGDLQNLHYESDRGMSHIYRCNLDGHALEARRYYSMRGGSDYNLRVDGELVDVSEYTARRIYNLMADIEEEPAKRERKRKISDAKTRLSVYNLPDEERNKLLDTDNMFKQLEDK